MTTIPVQTSIVLVGSSGAPTPQAAVPEQVWRDPKAGTRRVARGGSWILDPRIDGVTFRLKCLPSRRRDYLGFRPVLPGGPGKQAD